LPTPWLIRSWMHSWRWQVRTPPDLTAVAFSSGLVARADIVLPTEVLNAHDLCVAQQLLVTALSELIKEVLGTSVSITSLDDAVRAFDVVDHQGLNREIGRRIGLPLGWRTEYVDMLNGSGSVGGYVDVPGVGSHGDFTYPTTVSDILDNTVLTFQNIGYEQFLLKPAVDDHWTRPRSSVISDIGLNNRELTKHRLVLSDAFFAIEISDPAMIGPFSAACESLMGLNNLGGITNIRMRRRMGLADA